VTAPGAAAGTPAEAAANNGPGFTVVDGAVFESGHSPVDAVQFGSEIVAAGYIEVDVPTAAVWVSEDGTAWEQVGRFESDTRIGGLATDGEVLVAVGTANDGGPDDRAAVWVSTDGVDWAAVAADPDVFPEGSEIVAVAYGPPFVAVGSLPAGDRTPDGFFSVSATWVSEDGARWTARVDPARGLDLLDVVAGGPGFVAVGSTVTEDLPGRPIGAVLVSGDGIGWSAVPNLPVVDPLDEACEVYELEALASGPLELLATGACGEDLPVLWTSTDGVEWTWAYPLDLRRPGVIADVAVTNSGFLAVGMDLPSDDDPVGAVWYSADGVVWAFQQDETWVQVSAPGAATVDVPREQASALAGSGFGLLAETDVGLVAVGFGPDRLGRVYVGEER
jgi:hypothetical protein